MEVREEHQDNPRGTRDVLTSQTVTFLVTQKWEEEGLNAMLQYHRYILKRRVTEISRGCLCTWSRCQVGQGSCIWFFHGDQIYSVFKLAGIASPFFFPL
jgi:hypothetical protein